jgi:energy-coupling factor transporter transmembrane protein EcfT
LAMEARGFTGKVRVLNELVWSRRDTAWLVFCVLYLGMALRV